MFSPDAMNLLTGEELSQTELDELLKVSEDFSKCRREGKLSTALAGKTLGMLFEKPSLRTRFSFSVAMFELGGFAIECVAANMKKEEPEDIIRVLQGYCHALMVRTHEHGILERMTSKSLIPIINGLSDSHHPCQVLADLLTLKQTFGALKGLKLAYIGDGNNILHSLLLLAPFLGVHLSYSCPEGYEPNAFIVKRAKARALKGGGSIQGVSEPLLAVRNSNAIYTDVWTSMGFEDQVKEREVSFQNFQVNEELYSHAEKGALIMHCLPMMRGKEITDTMVEHPASVIFRQSENRLYVQKAILCGLIQKQS